MTPILVLHRTLPARTSPGSARVMLRLVQELLNPQFSTKAEAPRAKPQSSYRVVPMRNTLGILSSS